MLTLALLSLFWASVVTLGALFVFRLVNLLEVRARLAELEAKLAGTLDQCEELLEASKRLRNSATAAASRAKRVEQPGLPGIPQDGGAGVMNPEQELAAVADYYARKGSPWRQ
jgi:hypothetical protein